MVIHPLFFLPPATLYARYLHTDVVLLEVCDHYQKRTFRNRYWINTSHGPLCLSIPLTKGKNNQCPVKNVRISYDENWVGQHILSIRSGYGKSPYFEHYFPYFEKILTSRHTFLADLSLAAFEWSVKSIGIKNEVRQTTEFIENYPHHVADLRHTHWQSPASISQPPIGQGGTYTQTWQGNSGFISGLSILDALFCCGPECFSVLKSIKVP